MDLPPFNKKCDGETFEKTPFLVDFNLYLSDGRSLTFFGFANLVARELHVHVFFLYASLHGHPVLSRIRPSLRLVSTILTFLSSKSADREWTKRLALP